MSDSAKHTVATVIPTLRYQDAADAIQWLCNAFGFRPHLVVPGEDDEIAHAQLVFGNGMIMLASAQEDDVDEHYARAMAAGAEVVVEIKDEDYGGRVYSCRDPEGFLWNFGSYDPWIAA